MNGQKEKAMSENEYEFKMTLRLNGFGNDPKEAWEDARAAYTEEIIKRGFGTEEPPEHTIIDGG